MFNEKVDILELPGAVFEDSGIFGQIVNALP
jgi:hypothetical protein